MRTSEFQRSDTRSRRYGLYSSGAADLSDLVPAAFTRVNIFFLVEVSADPIHVLDHLSPPPKMIFSFMMGGRRAIKRSDTSDAGRFMAGFSLRTSKTPRSDKVRKVAPAALRAKLNS